MSDFEQQLVVQELRNKLAAAEQTILMQKLEVSELRKRVEQQGNEIVGFAKMESRLYRLYEHFVNGVMALDEVPWFLIDALLARQPRTGQSPETDLSRLD